MKVRNLAKVAALVCSVAYEIDKWGRIAKEAGIQPQ
jgi:hypothetical protein